MNSLMNSEENAILLHDIRAAMLNHAGLHREVQESLLQLTDVLQSLLPGEADENESGDREALKNKVNEILVEDVEQCMPMLQLSSNKLSELLSTMVHVVVQTKSGVDVDNSRD